MHHDPQYYPLRNHLVDFLLNRRTKRPMESWMSRDPEAGTDAIQRAEPAAVPAAQTQPVNPKEAA
jgi:hypothetical protein